MRDFESWLADTTEYLREDVEADAFEWDLDAHPEPCEVCGSTEEVCECEEEANQKWVAGRHSHSISYPEGPEAHTHGSQLKAHLCSGCNMSYAVEVGAPVPPCPYCATARHPDHQLAAYAQQFLRTLNQHRHPGA